MSGLKFQSLRPVVIIIIMLSAIYLLALLKLLQPHNTNIALTEKEINGLIDFKIASALYFELNTTQNPEVVADKLLRVILYHNKKSWNKAKQDVGSLDTPSFSDVSNVLRHLIRDIGDESELILDSKLPVYYTVDLMFKNIPLLMENVLIHRNNPARPLQTLPYTLDDIDHSLQAIDDEANCKQCAMLKQIVIHIKDDLFSPSSATGKSLNLVAEVEKITNSSSDILRELLQDRLANQIHQKDIVLVIVLLLYAISVKLVIFALHNYVSKREVDLSKERQKLIGQLAQKNDELEQFAYAAAHDLKEPIRTMRCFATLLKNESADELTPETAEYLGVIENTAQRAEQMINDLLGYTQVNKEALAIEICDSGKELAKVLEDLKSAIKPLNPEITILELPIINTVPAMFRRVMLNLIDNAIKYRRANVPLAIIINANKQENNWVFSVQDNGIGLSEKHAEEVFEPFRRLEQTSYKEGSGIGLTACRKAIEHLGGNIWITPNVDGGITVFFSLPITI